MRESISEFMDRQNRRVARFGQAAQAAAHQAYGQAVRSGRDLKLGSPGDVIRYGAQLIQEADDRAASAISRNAQEGIARSSELLRRVSQNPMARSVAIDAARTAGNVAGVVRGGVHAAEGLIDGVTFMGRLVDPLDALNSAPGESAIQRLGRGVANGGRMSVDYVRKGVADPQSVVADMTQATRQWRRELDPSAAPMASTFEGELRRNFDIGQNQGELAFDVGSLFVGGPTAKGMRGLERVSNIGNVERYLAQGFGPEAAAHLAEPYPLRGMGHHFIPRRTGLPRSYSDSVFNVLKPEGISRGDFYELHYKVDPSYKGGKVKGEQWSGKALSLKRYGLAGRLWHGSPPPLKARVGGLGGSGGAAIYVPSDEEVD